MRTRLTAEGARVLGGCVWPGAPADTDTKRAGLVLGYVQSGKTSSFTTVTALAHDNGFRLIVIIAGTTTLLQNQTEERLAEDLGLRKMDAFRRWVLLKNPAANNDAGPALVGLLQQHADPDGDHDDLGVPLVIVMKQHTHLDNLIQLLDGEGSLHGITALVVDDEAHMHSPNVGKGALESPTYAKIKSLRKCLPRHTLLQYTATPQATLLANIADELSPDFVRLLHPGSGYTGGQHFFIEHHDTFVQTIDDSELYALDPEEFAVKGPPASLRKAFLSYLLACAASRASRDPQPLHSSMLVHPHSRKDVHTAWLRSIESMQADVLDRLSLDDSDPDRIDFIANELVDVHKVLLTSDPAFPAVDTLVPYMKIVLQRLRIKSINSAGNTDVPWGMAEYWVLVGGNLLGVGFTVEGLRTTHMMRSVGVRLADTLQQRARFFGYKAPYAKTCQAWIQPDLDAAFIDYVKHEKAIRASLTGIEESGRSLRQWKRVFLLDPAFKPTRAAARRVTLDPFHLDDDGWCLQRVFVAEEIDLLVANRETIDRACSALTFHADGAISGDTGATKHSVAETDLSTLRSLLADLTLSGTDSTRFTAVGLMLAAAADEHGSDILCNIVQMAAGWHPNRRQRAVAWAPEQQLRVGRVSLHQGRNPKVGPPRYAGDNKARATGRVTLQLHRLDLLERTDGPVAEGAEDVPFVAIYLPATLRAGVLQAR